MVAAVNELETTPLIGAERAKGVVGGESGFAEELLAFVAENVEAGQMVCGCGDELGA